MVVKARSKTGNVVAAAKAGVDGTATASSGKVVAFPGLATVGSVPLYEIVKQRISEAILCGEWPTGAVLPSEVSLGRTLGVAVGTVRRALNDLSSEGLLVRRRKTGTVVTGRTPHHSFRFFFHYFRLHARNGSMVRSRVEMLSIDRSAPTARERGRLRLPPQSEVIRIDRLRFVGGRPIMRDRYVLPSHLLSEFPSRIDEVPDLLYLTLQDRYGIRISAVREEITAELASKEDIGLLRLAAPAPVLNIDEINFDQSGAPVMLGSHTATTERHCYINEVR